MPTPSVHSKCGGNVAALVFSMLVVGGPFSNGSRETYFFESKMRYSKINELPFRWGPYP